ncbi:hypothetical protein F3Y22_tig00000973pilonHSYRG00025 [Hibiscus syriacus]|uniref:Uncharacterized protein n=1 Tax=Hibiscus syriacus TaxID=106335 RepID=A0A6A3CWS6_HIBSY|nr:hypothetical protein F3Y22_tig00000973pilonHSYRG00025 [Hibiscus syriacus]
MEGGPGKGGDYGCSNSAPNCKSSLYKPSPPLSAIERFLWGQNHTSHRKLYSTQNNVNISKGTPLGLGSTTNGLLRGFSFSNDANGGYLSGASLERNLEESFIDRLLVDGDNHASAEDKNPNMEMNEAAKISMKSFPKSSRKTDHWNATKRRQNSRKKIKQNSNQNSKPQSSILQIITFSEDLSSGFRYFLPEETIESDDSQPFMAQTHDEEFQFMQDFFSNDYNVNIQPSVDDKPIIVENPSKGSSTIDCLTGVHQQWSNPADDGSFAASIIDPNLFSASLEEKKASIHPSVFGPLFVSPVEWSTHCVNS